MRIGELAKHTNVDITTIRYYEQEGLLPVPLRSPAGYRLYDPSHQDTLQFIRHCRSLDMSLAEVRSLLNYRQHPELNCEGINQIVDTHINQVRERIGQLQQLEQQLSLLQARCSEKRQAENCGILQILNNAAERPVPSEGCS